MTTVADVLMLFEKLLDDNTEEKKEIQSCLRDICEEYDAHKLRKMISGECWTVVSRNYDNDSETTSGTFRTKNEAARHGDEIAKAKAIEEFPKQRILLEIERWKEDNPGKPRPPGWWMNFFSYHQDHESVFIEKKTMFRIPEFDSQETQGT